MKGFSIYSHPELSAKARWDFLNSPYLSVRSLKRKTNRDLKTTFVRLVTFGSGLALMAIWAQSWERKPNYLMTLVFSLSVYFLTETLGAVGLLLFSWKNSQGASIHRRPILSKTLTEFWGQNWNVWVIDWLKDVDIFFRTSPKFIRTAGIFCCSGLIHELMVNLPYWLVFKQSYFGNMMMYFCVQAVGLMIEKKFVRRTPNWFQQTYLWLVVFLPVPLFVAPPFLIFFGMHHG